MRSLLTLLTVVGLLAACGSDFEQVTEGRVGLSRTSIDFRQTQVGRSDNIQVQIENNGDGDLLIENIEIVGSSPYVQFSTGFLTFMALEYEWQQQSTAQGWVERPAFALRPQGEVQVDLVFSPDDTDVQCPSSDNCGTLRVQTNDRETPIIEIPITLNQSSGSICVDPTVVQFPDVTGGPFDGAFEITNCGAGPLEIQNVSYDGPAGVSLNESTNRAQPFSLVVGEDSTFNVTFTPDPDETYCDGEFDPEEGCTLGAVTVQSDDSQGRTVQVTLLIGGVSVPDIDVSESELEFDAAPGEPDTQTVDVSNTGGANLTWNVRIDPSTVRDQFSVEIDGTAVSAAGQQADPLAPGNTSTVAITLDPEDTETIRGQLVITSLNDPDERQTQVDLFAGEPVPELTVDPTQIYFGAVAPDSQATLSFVMTNTGRAPLNISSTTIIQSTEFSLDPDPTGMSVPAGDTLTIDVVYDRPLDDLSGLDHGVLTINSNALAPNDVYSINIFAYHETGALPPTCELTVTPEEPFAVDETITLDGAGSTAPEGGTLTANPHGWVITARPDGSAAELSANFGERVTLVPDESGTYSVLLTVTSTVGEGVTTQCQLERNLFVE